MPRPTKKLSDHSGHTHSTDDKKVDTRLTKKTRVCVFCQEKTLPSFIDSNTLKRFLSDRTRIVPKARSGACSKHQRQISKQIKYARHLSLMPFTSKI